MIFREVKLSNFGLVTSSFSGVFGINKTRSTYAINCVGLHHLNLISQVNKYRLNVCIFLLRKNYLTESGLKKLVFLNIQKKVDLGSYVGFRHLNSLPTRGQHTRTNGQTSRARKFIKVRLH